MNLLPTQDSPVRGSLGQGALSERQQEDVEDTLRRAAGEEELPTGSLGSWGLGTVPALPFLSLLRCHSRRQITGMWRSVPTATPKAMPRRQLNPAHKRHRGPHEPLSHRAETHAAIASVGFQTPKHRWPPQPRGADKILWGTILWGNSS